MIKFDMRDHRVKVFGLPLFYQNGLFERVPEYIRRTMPDFEKYGRRTTGARVCFRTNSTSVKVLMDLESISMDIGMSIFACQSANVYIGNRNTVSMRGLVSSASYNTTHAEAVFTKSAEMEDVTVLIPRNEIIANVSFEIEDGAEIELPTPYKYEKPILFYGSSITEGGCCARLACAYPAISSRHLDTDYINFGFSGSAKGEPQMADYIADIDISLLVMDYDYNSPSAEHLKNTHEAFFKRIRAKKPKLPVLMISCPNPEYKPEAVERLAVIRQTYENALAVGDKNVYFIDGREFYGETDRDLCSVDTTHPNDLGFYRMACVMEPVIGKILSESETR